MKEILFVCILIVSVCVAGCTTNSQKTDSIVQNATLTQPVSSTTNFQTQLSPDMVCMIADKKQEFTTASKSAWAFNLKNSPMYINYTIPETQTGSDNVDNSYYVITVREKNSGTVLSTAGFGKMTQGGFFGYPFSGYDVIRIMKSNDLLIEMEGKDITINYEIWVKPEGNVDDSFDINAAKCMKWPQAYKEGVIHSSGMNIGIDRGEE